MQRRSCKWTGLSVLGKHEDLTPALLLKEGILVLRVLESIRLERLVTDQGIVGPGASRVNLKLIAVCRRLDLRKHHECSSLLVRQLLWPVPLFPHPPTTIVSALTTVEKANHPYFSSNNNL